MSIQGVDLSHFNVSVDFHTMKAAGIQFVALKATEGANYVDPTFADRRTRAESVGFGKVILYHFIRGDVSAVAQAQNFARTVRGLGENELIAFDIEGDSWSNLSPEESAELVVSVVAEVKAAIGAHDPQVLIYGSPGWLRGQFGDQLSRLTNWDLWAARYNSEIGDVSPWPSALIWQYGERGSVPGAGSGDVDTDVWLGEWQA